MPPLRPGVLDSVLTEMGVGQPEEPDPSFPASRMRASTPMQPTQAQPEQEAADPSLDLTFGEQFPHAEAFSEGIADAVSFGMMKPQQRDLLSSEGVAQIAGMIVGEIPFWLVGGGITKMLLTKGAKQISTAARMGGAFGKTASIAKRHGIAIGEATTAVGIDVARFGLGDDEEALSPTRLAVDVSIPFASSMLKIARQAQKVKKAKKGLKAAGTTISSDTGIKVYRQADVDEALKVLDEESAAKILAAEDLFILRPEDDETIEALVILAQRGAPWEDIMLLSSVDDAADYMLRSSKYPINRPAEKGWPAEAAKRQGIDVSAIRHILMSQTRGPLLPSVRGEIPLEEVPDVLGRQAPSWIYPRVPPAKYIGAERQLTKGYTGITRPPTILESRPPTSTLSRAADTGLPEQHIRYNVHGASESSEDLIVDSLNKVPLISPPVGKMDEVTRGYVDAVANWPLIKQGIVSSLRVIQSMGEEGRQLAGHLSNVRLHSARWFGKAQADMLNSFREMKTKEQYMMFAGHLNSGSAITDSAVQNAVTAFRSHHKYMEKMLSDQGTKVLMADGKTKTPLAEMIMDHFFPHKHDWDAVLKDPELTAMASRAIKDKFGDAFASMSERQILTKYIDKSRTVKMPRFSSLFERNVDMPGWLGDPATAFKKSDKAYKADVQEVVLQFLEDGYSLAAANRHLGAPSGMGRWDDMNLMTDLAPIHNVIKSRISIAHDTVQMRIAAGKVVSPEHELTRLAAFKSPRALEAAGRKGDDFAQRILDESEAQYLKGATDHWRVNGLLKGMDENGHDYKTALSLVENVLGSRQYDPGLNQLSKHLRNYNIVTKLGVLVVENVGQLGLTAMKVGFRNSYKALKDIITKWDKSVEFARVSGSLGEDALRHLEAEAGRSFAGEFLQKTGFSWSEKMLRTHAAVSGKYYVTELFENIAKGKGTGLTRKAQEIKFNTSVRLLRKLKFNTDQFVNRKTGELTGDGVHAINSIRGDGEKGLQKVLRQMGGFEVAHQTQFFADAMDTPLAQAHPIGKIMYQYKSFLANTTKFIMRDLVDELAHGNPAPMVRAVLAGVAIGEVTQGLRSAVAGESPLKRGQQGWVRDLIGEVPDDDETAFQVLGQRFSKSDVAARVIENYAGIGLGGVFFSMLQSATTGGKLRMLEFFGGPSVGSAVDILSGVAKAATIPFGGDYAEGEPLARRVLREGGGPLGALLPVPGGAFAGAALGRTLQMAAVPTDFQKERSMYITPDEMREVAKKQVVRRYNEVRGLAKKAIANGDHQKAMRFISNWNRGVRSELDKLIEVGALNYGIIQRLVFDSDDIKRLVSGVEEEPGVFERTAERLSAPFAGSI